MQASLEAQRRCRAEKTAAAIATHWRRRAEQAMGELEGPPARRVGAAWELQQLATEADNLGVKGVYQLQGGIHKYLDENPDGGFWSGKVSKVPALAKTPRLSLSLPPF